MPCLFLSNGSALHQAIIDAFEARLNVVSTREALMSEIEKSKSAGLVILDAEYVQFSGYAICEEIKISSGDAWRVHLISNENVEGVAEKAAYAGVDRLFVLPEGITELCDE